MEIQDNHPVLQPRLRLSYLLNTIQIITLQERFQVLAAVIMNMTVFWVVMLYGLVEID
jgi:predicted acyltransferase